MFYIYPRLDVCVANALSLLSLLDMPTRTRTQGVLQLYRGITPTLLGILPYAGIAFTINDKANQKVTG